MSKFTYLFDPGHGGIVGGKYVTPGKRSPVFDNGTVLYEGVNNRELVKMLLAHCRTKGIDCQDIVNSNDDVSLQVRVSRANAANKTKPCVYISIHSDAAGDGKAWNPASGISVYTSKGQTKSDTLAQFAIMRFQEFFKNSVKYRTDNSDGDADKEENFYVLANTDCPAILCEIGFHTNEEEAERMLTFEWRSNAVLAIVAAIEDFEAANA